MLPNAALQPSVAAGTQPARPQNAYRPQLHLNALLAFASSKLEG